MGRLQLARHGIDLLRSKEEALQREQARLEGHVTRTKVVWESSCQDAAACLLIARALGASDELAAIVNHKPHPTTVTPHWEASMGINYPGVVDVTFGREPTLRSTAALQPTASAHEVALRAATAHASTSTALRRLAVELKTTRRRRRAIEQRLVPRLESHLHDLDLDLDEQDREEALRVQIATSHSERRHS